MAFIDVPAEHDLDAEGKAMYERQRAHYGYVPNWARVFGHRPEVLRLWAALLGGIKRHMELRRFELATFAAACELRSTLCALAHGEALCEFLGAEDVRALARGALPACLSREERAIVELARRVARDATTIEPEDVRRAKALGLSDAEVFDVVAAAAGRAFFTKVIEALGTEADARYDGFDPALRAALEVGRPVDSGAWRPRADATSEIPAESCS